ncbi:MAG: haloacid dehalogenase [Pseudonocardiales bacterium]|nr:haloacid dehalogenase [Pseudonocardiales bacterium]
MSPTLSPEMSQEPPIAEPDDIEIVLFDLDGTISDSAPGILASLRIAFDELGLPPLDAATERSILGPPFRESMPPLVGADRVEEVVDRYRLHYGANEGMLLTSAYDGIGELLERLKTAGKRIGLATSKAEFFAPKILTHLGFADYFEVICGDDLEGNRGSKALVVGEALKRFGHPSPSLVRMVGDRLHDVLGAGEHGLPTLGAGWGYGAPGELETAGALVVVGHPDELDPYLGLG